MTCEIVFEPHALDDAATRFLPEYPTGPAVAPARSTSRYTLPAPPARPPTGPAAAARASATTAFGAPPTTVPAPFG